MITTPAVLEPGLLSSVTPVIIGHEGERLQVYDDSLGIPSAGVGLALMVKVETASGEEVLRPSPYAQQLCARCGVDYKSVVAGAKKLTQGQSRALLNLCIIDAIEDLVKLFPAFWSYTQPRQIGLVDMRFNLGETKFRGFKQMISCILAGDWDGAVAQALHSKWAYQLPKRADYDAALLRGNTNDGIAR